MPKSPRRLHVSLVAIPDVMVSSLSGLFDVLTSFRLLGTIDDTVPAENPFIVEVVGPSGGLAGTASGMRLDPHRTLTEVTQTDVVIVPSMLVKEGEWTTGRYPEFVDWLRRMHRQGAQLCSACSGVLLLAETGLLDGWEATVHWAYTPTFRRNFSRVRLRVEEVLVVTGSSRELVMSGASASWHDLVLYLIARHVGPTAAQTIARFMLLQWHPDGQAPYIAFDPPMDHEDPVVLRAQEWLTRNFGAPAPVQDLVRRSGLPERTFKRRFRRATGLAPIAYVQLLRIEEAKRRLERTSAPIDEIGWAVGYEDPAFFRRLFKRTTRITPGAYRRRFMVPPEPA